MSDEMNHGGKTSDDFDRILKSAEELRDQRYTNRPRKTKDKPRKKVKQLRIVSPNGIVGRIESINSDTDPPIACLRMKNGLMTHLPLRWGKPE